MQQGFEPCEAAKAHHDVITRAIDPIRSVSKLYSLDSQNQNELWHEIVRQHEQHMRELAKRRDAIYEMRDGRLQVLKEVTIQVLKEVPYEDSPRIQ